MLLDTMSLKLFHHWGETLQLTSLSMVKAAELAGRLLDECVERQRFEFGAALLHGANALRWAWESTAQSGTKRTISTHRVALVTGGTGGLGAGICVHLAAAGHQVVATYPRRDAAAARQWQWAQRQAGYDIAIIECEVGQYEDCARMAAWVVRRFRQVDCLVNCTDDRRNGALGPACQESWNAVLEANLDSVFNVTRNVMPGMVERHYGKIINVAARNGSRADRPESHRAAAAAGMVGFTKSLARQLADQGITVNSVSRAEGASSAMSALPEDLRAAILAKVPRRRQSQLNEIAVVVTFLADDASSDLTGADIAVNGDLLRTRQTRPRATQPREVPFNRVGSQRQAAL